MTNEDLIMTVAAALEKKLITEEVYDETLKVVFEEMKKKAAGNHTHNADAITDGTTKAIPTKAKQTEWDKKVTKEELNAAVNTFASGLAWKGVFNTLEDLKAKITNPKEGDFVIVIKEPTYPKNTLLIYEGAPTNAWQTIGELFIPGKATQEADGLMSKEDKKKLDGLNNYTLQPATTDRLGGVKAKNGNAVTIGGDGAIGIDDARTVQNGERDKWNKTATDLPNVKSTADNALAKANANEQSINTANGKITTLEGKLVYLSIEDARTIINKYKA